MIARVRKALDEKEQGFTLVELLVVVIIIGILSAIAIPMYMNQQAKAKDSAAKTDLANLRLAVVSVLTENPSASSVNVSGAAAGGEVTIQAQGGDDSAAVGDAETFQSSPGVEIAKADIAVEADTTFCLHAVADGGKSKEGFKTTETGVVEEGTCGE